MNRLIEAIWIGGARIPLERYRVCMRALNVAESRTLKPNANAAMDAAIVVRDRLVICLDGKHLAGPKKHKDAA